MFENTTEAGPDVRHFRLAGDAAASRRRRQMTHVDARAERAFADVEIRLDRIELPSRPADPDERKVRCLQRCASRVPE
jgi:hypothetical protein